MSIRNTTPSTNGEKKTGWYQGRKASTVRQLVNLTHGASYVALNVAVPPRGRVISAYLAAVTALSVTGNDGTNTANAAALMMFPTTNTQAVTAPPTTATQSNPTGTSGFMLGITTSTASNALRRGAPMFETSVLAQNTNTVDALLCIVPAFTNSNRVQINGTNAYVFGTSTASSATTAGQMYAVLQIEEYDDLPAF